MYQVLISFALWLTFLTRRIFVVALYRILSDRARGLSLVLIGFFCVRYCLYFDRAYKLKNQGSLFLTRVNSVISDSNSQEQFCKMAVFCGIFFSHQGVQRRM